ncbi:MAG: hypothetical protein A3H96_03670 [Acidobacteria bacterium RIFCSPLOWO2_02_FULL_67_36]|nr:MAG: hypothetical protein A3H96_03670 [Acidobacteria bacterium RIFCSPLOWO2_02_FULL_67_36]OFW24653.1 MAG: hypothetical protein A3G21_17045 [Acidobacteria bacterium RIFCSPLOWO2_12_FULL_66_21]
MSLLIHPIRLFLLAALVCWAAASIGGGWRRWVAPVATAGSVAVILALAIFAGWYIAAPTYYDWIEPSVPSVGWTWLRGGEMYPRPDSWLRYSHPYGPLTFLVQAAFLGTFGPSVAVSKIPGVLALILSLLCVYRACRRHASSAVALWLAAIFSGLCLWMRTTSFWDRPDPLIVLAVSAAVLVCEAAGLRLALAGTMLATAAVLDLRLTSVAILLPVFAVMWQRAGARRVVSVVAAGAVLSAALFLLPRIDLAGFVARNEQLSQHGISARMVLQNGKWCLWLIGLWGVVAVARSRAVSLVESAATALALLLAVVTGATPAGGVHHVLPIVPIVLWQVARARVLEIGDRSRFAVAVCAASGIMWAAVGASGVIAVAHEVRQRLDRRMASGLSEFVAAAGVSSVALGYGATAEPQFVMPELVFRGSPLVIDALTVIDTQAAGQPISEATLTAIRTCRVGAWLIPAGERPFSMKTVFQHTASREAFDESFRAAFMDAYTRAARVSGAFDLWTCRDRR